MISPKNRRKHLKYKKKSLLTARFSVRTLNGIRTERSSDRVGMGESSRHIHKQGHAIIGMPSAQGTERDM